MDDAFGRPPRTRPLLINITPLVDVTLLLLIFFMVTATFREMSALDIQVPSAASGVSQPITGCEIVIDADGALKFEQVPVAHNQLRPLLRAWIAEHPGAEVTIRADKRVSYEHVASVLDSVRLEGVEQVALPVIPQGH